jgi:hypothetical protein
LVEVSSTGISALSVSLFYLGRTGEFTNTNGRCAAASTIVEAAAEGSKLKMRAICRHGASSPPIRSKQMRFC